MHMPDELSILETETDILPVEEIQPATFEAPADYSRFSDFDVALFKAGNHYRLYDKLGAHLASHNGQQGIYFAVWAPNAERFPGWKFQWLES